VEPLALHRPDEQKRRLKAESLIHRLPGHPAVAPFANVDSEEFYFQELQGKAVGEEIVALNAGGKLTGELLGPEVVLAESPGQNKSSRQAKPSCSSHSPRNTGLIFLSLLSGRIF
jgi:hypothetical protein